MAKMDLITTMTLNSAGFADGIDKAKQKTAEMKQAIISNTKDMSTGVQGLGNVFSTLGNSIGESGSQITGVMSAIMTAVTPIAGLVAVIGLLAEAWKKGKEQIEAYNKESDKAKYGASAFTADSGKALKDTQKRATGGIKEGTELLTDAYIKIEQLNKRRTEDNKEQVDIDIAKYRLQVTAGKQMVDDNEALLKSIGYNSIIKTSIVDSANWTLKYNDLLNAQEQLNVDRVKSETEITAQQAQLAEMALKIKLHTTDTAERRKLIKEYEQIALNIQTEKLGLLDREEKINSGLFSMTGQDEKIKMNGLNIEKQRQDVHLQYAETMKGTARMQNSITTDAAKELSILKQKNNETMAGFKLGEKNVNVGSVKNPFVEERAGEANTKQLLKGIDVGANLSPITNADKQLRAYQGTLKSTIDLNNKFAESQEALASIMNSVSESLSQGANSFKEFGKAIKDEAKQAIGAMVAQGVTSMIMNALKTAQGPLLFLAPVIAGLAAGLAKTAFNSLIPSFAEGGLSAGGWSLVGERGSELVKLPQGAQVFNSSQTNSMLGGNGGGVLTTKVSGTDLMIVLNNTQRRNNNFR